MKNRRLTIFAVVAGVVLAGLLVAGPPNTLAQIVPDWQIAVQQSSGPAAGGDPNLITNTGTFYINAQGSHVSSDPVLIIVGVFDGTSSTSTPTISYGPGDTLTASLATVGTYGLTANKTTFLPGGNGNTASAYAALGLADGGSETFGNWACGGNGCPGTGGDASLGLTPTSFELFAFAVPINLSGSYALDESGAPNGSYIIAYSCENGKEGSGTPPGACTGGNGNIASTPYTNAGFLDAPPTDAPEASAVTLTSLVLLAFGALVFRARRHELT